MGSFRLSYLIDDVTVLSVDLGDGAEVPQEPEGLVELRVGALVFVLIGHEEEEGVHTWKSRTAILPRLLQSDTSTI